MKKTLLITLDYLPQIGGVANYWSGLNRYLPVDLFYILAPQIKGYTDKEKNIIRKKMLDDFFWPRWLRLIIIVLMLNKKQNFYNFIAAQILPIGTVLYILKKLNFIENYFISCHGFDISQLKGRKKFLAKKIMIYAKKIIVNSDYTGKIVQSYNINKDKIVIIKPCPQISLSFLSSQLIKQTRQLDETFNLLTVARLVRRKGIDRVLEALPYVWEKIPKVKYTIVGEGSERFRLEKLVAKIKANKKINFVGKIDNQELAKIYLKHDLFIMLPRNIKGDVEGFGMVYLEAGLFNLPVLATASGGITEAVKHKKTGLILPENSSAKVIADAIVELLSQPKLLKIYGQNNRRWAESFSWQKQAYILNNLLSK